jgi:RNA polymerase sigma-32 factor
LELRMTTTRRFERSSGIKALEKAAGSRIMLSRAEEQQLARLAKAGDQSAFERLVCAHIPLVFAMASEFRSYGLPPDELLSEGLLGLVKAARDFDPERGSRLAGYAAWWIRAYLRSHTLANRRIVRGPATRNARKALAGLAKAERVLGQKHGERPCHEAIARELGVEASDIEDARALLSKRDTPYGVMRDGRTFDLASEAPSPEAIVARADEQRATRQLVQGALSRLDPRAQRILRERYLRGKATSLADLGRELGISRERVRQLEGQAKAAVRAAIAPKGTPDQSLSRVA